jgi:hypothetical protein
MLKAKYAASKEVNKLNISCRTCYYVIFKGTTFVNDLNKPHSKTSISKIFVLTIGIYLTRTVNILNQNT